MQLSVRRMPPRATHQGRHTKMAISRLLGLAASSMLVLAAGTARAGTAGVFDSLYTFAGDNTDGNWPAGALVADPTGTIWGTTSSGGPNGAGTVFKYTPGGTETMVYHFTGGNDGDMPDGGLLKASNGDFFGTTYIGGKYGLGTIFKVTPAGVLTTIYSFGTNANDGGNPRGELIWSADHQLAGVTVNGGAGNVGTVFKVSLQGKETILHGFAGPDGQYPRAALVMDKAGNMYGTTYDTFSSAVNAGNGTAFKIDPAGNFTVIYNFLGATGYGPSAPMVLDPSGNLIGTTQNGGADNNGAIFKLTPAGKATVLYTFTGGNDGGRPIAPVTLTKAGAMLSTTFEGGKNGYGTVYRLTAAGKLQTLHTFDSTDGRFSQSGLLIDAPVSELFLYGLTYSGGSNGNGNIYSITR